VLLAASAPADLDFWQAAKAIFNCQATVRDGGWLVLLTPCPGGIPAEHQDFDRAIGLEPRRIEELLAAQAGSGDPGGGRTGGRRTGGRRPGDRRSDPTPDRVTLAPALALARFRTRIRIGVVSPGLKAEQIARMGFRAFASVEQALGTILPELPASQRRVDVVTHGGATFPFVGSEVP
jgi:hypothetical protein